MSFKSKRHQTIYVPIAANATAGQTFPIPQQNLLQDIEGNEPVYIRRIDAYCTTTISGIPNQIGLPVATPADLINAVLTLRVQATDQWHWLPLAIMNPYNSDAANYVPSVQDPFLLADTTTIDWGQSYITLLEDAPTTSAFGYVFGVHFLYLRDMVKMKEKDIDWPDI